MTATFAHNAQAQHPPLSSEIVQRSLVELGDPARLHHVMARARRGESVTFAVIGGSITQGAGASAPEHRWANRVHNWWRQTFPEAEITLVNAGIGATGSDYGVFRLKRDLLPHEPDVVVVEFAVNDGAGTAKYKATMEGLLRQILKQPNQPAVLQLFTMNNAGANSQEEKAELGRHYGLPMASYRDALWPEVKAGRIAFKEITADVIHPNDRGHSYAADFVIALLEKIHGTLPADESLPAVRPLPEPLFSDDYEETVMYEPHGPTPLRNTAGDRLEPVYKHKANVHDGRYRLLEPGAELAFSIAGDIIELQVGHTSNFYACKAEVQVNDREPMIIDTWWRFGFDGLVFHQLGKDLGPGPHRVVLKLLEEKNPSARAVPEGTRHPALFVIHRITTAGEGGGNVRSQAR